MGKLAKRYVLVDQDVYDRKMGKGTEAAKRNLPNPFKNQHVVEAQNLRRRMYEISRDDSLSPSEANEMIGQLMTEYTSRFKRVGMKQQHRRNARPQRLSLMQKDDLWNDGGNQRLTGATPKRFVKMNQRSLSFSPDRRVRKRRLSDSDDEGGRRFADQADVVDQFATAGEDDDRESLTEYSTPSDKLPVMTRLMIPEILEQDLDESQVEKAYPLLNEMVKVGLLNEEKGTFEPIKARGLSLKGSAVKEAINDILFRSPAQRTTNPKRVNSLIDYLNERGVVQTPLRKASPRKSLRNKRP